MAATFSDADQLLQRYIYDYLIKAGLHETAESFRKDCGISDDQVGLDAPDGFPDPDSFWSEFSSTILVNYHKLIEAESIDPSMSKIEQNMQQLQISSTHVTNPLLNTLQGLSIKGEGATSTSTGIVREEAAEGEASSLYFRHPTISN